MDISNTFLTFSIFAIIIFCTVVLQGLTVLYTQTKEWRFLSLMLIPLAFDLTYLWIGLYNPNADAVRSIVRTVIIFSTCNGTHSIYTYINRLSREKKKRESVPNVKL